jgi:protease I
MKLKKFSQFILENLNLRKAVIITDSGFQDAELLKPLQILEGNDVEVIITAPSTGPISAYNSKETIEITKPISELNPEDYDILILPGGKAPEKLRKDRAVLDFVIKFASLDRPIAAICHGPLILVSAGLVSGRQMTSYKDCVDELVSNGVDWIDDGCVIDENLITSRNPDDIPQFCLAILEALK